MIPKVREIINDLFGVKPPKIDIIFGQTSALIPELSIETAAESLYGVYLKDNFSDKYPFILHPLPALWKFWSKVGNSLKIQVNPAHHSVISLSEEYSHYVLDWIHDFKRISKERQLIKLMIDEKKSELERIEAIMKLCIILGKREAIGEIAEEYVIRNLGYSDDFEELSLLKKLLRPIAMKGSIWDKIFAISHALGEYYADTVPKEKKEFQNYVKKDFLVVTKTDLIEAEMILSTEFFF